MSERTVGQEEDDRAFEKMLKEWPYKVSKQAVRFFFDAGMQRGEENTRLREALGQLNDAVQPYCALQDGATDPRVGLVQPITVAEGNALNDAQDKAVIILEGRNA